jgi:hypothetical protein
MKLRCRLPLAVLVAALAAAAGFLPAAQAAPARPQASFTNLCGALAGTQPATVSHVMFIVFENKSYGAVVGKASAPYLNGTLITGCGLATNYHSYSHPSASNYLALTSGTAQGKAVSADCLPIGCPQSPDSIFAQLGNAGQSWREYAEAMPANCGKKNYDNTTISTPTAVPASTTTPGTLRRRTTPPHPCPPSARAGTCRWAPPPPARSWMRCPRPVTGCRPSASSRPAGATTCTTARSRRAMTG